MRFDFQQHASNSESDTNSVVSEPGSIADADSITNPNSVAESNPESDAYSNSPIRLISGDLVFYHWQKRVAPGDDYR